MSPSVVIGNTNAGPPPVLEQIRATGTPVVIIDTVTTLDGAPRKIRTVAQALGISAKGEELAATLESEIDEVESLSADAGERPTAVFLYMRGLDALFLIGEDHISHELFETSGAVSGRHSSGVVTEGYIPLTAESLAAADPDCIVVLTLGLESVGGREGLVNIPGVGQTAAAEDGCILAFDDQYFAGGGPRTGQVLMELLQAFHPDLAPGRMMASLGIRALVRLRGLQSVAVRRADSPRLASSTLLGAMLALFVAALFANVRDGSGRDPTGPGPFDPAQPRGASISALSSMPGPTRSSGTYACPASSLGILVGGSLGIAGAALQGVFRNPLAEPGIIGVSSGAAVGAVGGYRSRLQRIQRSRRRG